MNLFDPIASIGTFTIQRLNRPQTGSPASWRRSRVRQSAGGAVPLVITIALFLVAFLLRAWGARFGLPEYVYHPDEHAIVERATAILHTGDFSPHWFNYPSTYIYIQALTYIPYFLISAARGFGDAVPASAPYGFYYAGRLMTGLIGALTVPMVYFAGKQLFSRRTALISSVLLTFSLLHAVHSHYVTTDVPVTFFVLLSVLFCYQVMEKGEKRHSVLAGLFAGLAVSTKYTAFVMISPLAVCHLLPTRWAGWASLGRRAGLSFGSLVAGFLLGTPYAFLELNTFLNSLGSVLSHYSAGQPGFEGSNSGIWYLAQMLTSPDVLLVAIALGGLLWAAIRRTRADVLLLSFLVPYYLLLSVWRVRFERHLVVIFPLLATLAARLLVEGVSWILNRQPAMRKAQTAILACCTVLAIAWPALAIVDFDRAISQRDHRTVAAEWVNANIPSGSTVVTEAFSIPLDEERFEVLQLVRIDSQDLEWYREHEVDYVVVSDGHWRILLGQPERYSREVAIYHDILEHATRIQEFRRAIPSLLMRGYPTLQIYHFPDVLILKLARR